MFEEPIPRKNNLKFEPFVYPQKKKFFLPKSYALRKYDFLDVINNRKTSSKFNIPDKLKIFELLYHSYNIKSISEDKEGYLITKRTFPSAGARHPIDILVAYPNQNEILHVYNPIDHSLAELKVGEGKIKSFLGNVSDNIDRDNSFLFWFSIQVDKTESKYINPETLYWRDVGVVIYGLQIMATYLSLKTRPIGFLLCEKFERMFNGRKVISGGGILIGK